MTQVPEGDYGPPLKHDPNFNGPIHRRSCTDIICLIGFLVFVVCWAVVCGYAFSKGDVTKFLAPTSTDGLRCGFSDAVKNKPYLVFFDFRECTKADVALFGCRTPQVCVEKCPNMTVFEDQFLSTDSFLTFKSNVICTPDVDVSKISNFTALSTEMDNQKCARSVYKSKSVLNRCIGDISLITCTSSSDNQDSITSQRDKQTKSFQKDFFDFINSGISSILNSAQSVKRPRGGICKKDIQGSKMIESKSRDYKIGAMILEDLVNVKWAILIALVVVMVVCMFYIIIMRWIAGPVVWFTLLAIVGLLSFSIYMCYVNYEKYRNEIREQTPVTSIGGAFDNLMASKDTWLVLLIATCIVLFIVLIMIIFLRKRIVIAIALIKEGSKAVSSVFSTLFFPVFPWFFQVLVLALAVSACLFLSSIGKDTFQVKTGVNNEQCLNYTYGDICVPGDDFAQNCRNATCVYTGVTNDQIIHWMQAWNVVAFFWVLFFIQGAGDMMLAGTFATWYWTFNKSDVPYFTLTRSILRTSVYNLGTVAFGSLIITICRLIRILIEYVDQQCKKYDNFITKCLICCCRCFFACLESFLRFINKNAYIMCAVHGKGFCSSARKAFNLLMRNIIRVVVLDKVTDFLFFLSKLVVSVGCGAAAYYIFRESSVRSFIEMNQMNYDLVPALIVGIVAYFMASVFFSVYSMAVDTLFLCFLEDIERNDGSAERPYFMSKSLMKVLGKKNK